MKKDAHQTWPSRSIRPARRRRARENARARQLWEQNGSHHHCAL